MERILLSVQETLAVTQLNIVFLLLDANCHMDIVSDMVIVKLPYEMREDGSEGDDYNGPGVSAIFESLG